MVTHRAVNRRHQIPTSCHLVQCRSLIWILWTTRCSEGNRAFAPKAWATDDEPCPVAFYNPYMSLQPKGMMEPDSPFFLNVNHRPKPGNTARYIIGPMGHNTLGSILKFAGIRAIIERPITNQAGRKASITTLHNTGIDDALNASHSGHKSLEAVRQYYKPYLKDQRRMGKALGKSMGKLAIIEEEPREAHPRPTNPALQPATALGRAPSPPPEPEPEPEPAPRHVFRQPAPPTVTPRPDVKPAATPEDDPEVSFRKRKSMSEGFEISMPQNSGDKNKKRLQQVSFFPHSKVKMHNVMEFWSKNINEALPKCPFPPHLAG